MRISDWSSDVCSSDLIHVFRSVWVPYSRTLFGKLIKTLARGCIPPQLAAAHSPTCCFALQRPIIVPKNKLGSAIWHVGEIGLLAPRSRAPQWTPCWLTHVNSIAGTPLLLNRSRRRGAPAGAVQERDMSFNPLAERGIPLERQ